MKKTILLFAMAITASVAVAQKIDFGIRARYTNVNLKGSFNGSSINGNSNKLHNIDVGVFADINYGSSLTFQPGIAYVLKGGIGYSTEMPTPTSIAEMANDIKLNYLEIPLNLLYNFQLKPGKIFVGAGPYMGIALSGKSNNDTYIYGIDGTEQTHSRTKQSINFGSGQDDLKRFDYGINTMAGFRFNNKLEIGAAIGFGLANMSNISILKLHNHTESISVGYFFE